MNEEERRWRLIAEALGKRTGKPMPPFNWWKEHKEDISRKNPDYDDERLNRTVGHIWYHIYDDRRREAALVAEALHES